MTDTSNVAIEPLAALLHLSPHERAVLVLRDVLQWEANDVAELLNTNVAGVERALEQARGAIGSQAILVQPIKKEREE